MKYIQISLGQIASNSKEALSGFRSRFNGVIDHMEKSIISNNYVVRVVLC